MGGVQQQPTTRRIDSIQLLRALAATLVVLGHAKGAAFAHELLPADIRPLAFSGGFGVDLFFAISGFIIVHAGLRMLHEEQPARSFILRRIARIAPLYWAVTLLALFLTYVGGHALPGWQEIAASAAFLPYQRAGLDGFYPVFDLGWTLNYEMLFYVLFALCMGVSKRWCVSLTIAALCVLVLLGLGLPSRTGPLRFWTQPIILEFGAGMMIATLHRSGRLHLPVWLRVAFVIVAAALYLADPLGLGLIDTTPNSFVRVAAWGVPGTLLLTAAVAMPIDTNTRWAKAGILLGNASFALYLLHPFAIAFCEHALPYFPMPIQAQGWSLILGSFAAATAVSILAYRHVELPLTRHVTALLTRSNRNTARRVPGVTPARPV